MSSGNSGGCGCYILLLLFNLTIGAICFDYSLDKIFGKDVHWGADMVCGAVLGQVTVPAAIVCYVLELGGMEFPLVGEKKGEQVWTPKNSNGSQLLLAEFGQESHWRVFHPPLGNVSLM